MLQLAKQSATRPDARVRWLVDWIRTNLVPDGHWNDRRLILFTEWEDTRRWLQRRLLEALEDTDRIDERIDVFTGATGTDRRQAVKLAFNADPATEPLRILICTDAAREGINLQARCHDLIHVDVPWNPSRLADRAAAARGQGGGGCRRDGGRTRQHRRRARLTRQAHPVGRHPDPAADRRASQYRQSL